MTSLGVALTLVRVPRQLLALAPRLAPLFIISDLLEIETDLPEIEILSYDIDNKYQPHEGLILEL